MGWIAGFVAPGEPDGSGCFHVGKAHIQFCVIDRVAFNPAEIVLDAVQGCTVDGDAFATDGELLTRPEGLLDGCAAALEDLGFDFASDGRKGHV